MVASDPLTTVLSMLARTPFLSVHCSAYAGAVLVPAAATAANAAVPFLFDTARMANWSAACGHCTKNETVHCCGVCNFDGERCDTLYPNQEKGKGVADLLISSGFNLQVWTFEHPPLVQGSD